MKTWVALTWTFGVGLGVIGAVLLVVLLAVSVVDVANDEYALVYHTISRDFDRNQKPLEQGRYVLQPGQQIYTVKRVFQLISMQGETGVLCVSKDGLLLSLDITFQYRIQKDQLVTLFLRLGEQYQEVINLQTTGAIQNACSKYMAYDLYNSRQAVQQEMSDRVDENLAAVWADGGYLQLQNVRFHSTFNSAIQLTQQAIQDVTQANNERPQTLIKAQTAVLEAQQFAEFTLANARAEAQVIVANGVFQSASVNATLSAQLEAYAGIAQDLGLHGESLVNYISTQTIQNAKWSLVNVASPAKFSYPASAA